MNRTRECVAVWRDVGNGRGGSGFLPVGLATVCGFDRSTDFYFVSQRVYGIF